MTEALCLSSFGSQVAAALTSAERCISINVGTDNALPTTEANISTSIGTFSYALFIPTVQYYGKSYTTDNARQHNCEYILPLIPNLDKSAFPNPITTTSYRSYYQPSPSPTYFMWSTTSDTFVVSYVSNTQVTNFLKRVVGIIAVLS